MFSTQQQLSLETSKNLVDSLFASETIATPMTPLETEQTKADPWGIEKMLQDNITEKSLQVETKGIMFSIPEAQEWSNPFPFGSYPSPALSTSPQGSITAASSLLPNFQRRASLSAIDLPSARASFEQMRRLSLDFVPGAARRNSIAAENLGRKPPPLFKCNKPYCTKVYKNPNGLRYHHENGNCELDATTAQLSTRQELLECQAKDVKITAKPYFCKVAGCGDKRYKNVNGLKYHAKTAHPELNFSSDIKGMLAKFRPF